MIRFVCPECDEKMKVADDMAGETIECAGCGAEVTVEGGEAPRKKSKSRASAGKRSGGLRTADLRQVAQYQRGVLLALLAYIGVGVASLAVGKDDRTWLLPVAIPVIITAAVFVFLLATKVYGSAGIALAVLTLVPLLGLLILLVVNQKATGTLQAAGYKVGFLGASLSQFDDPIDDEEDE